MGRIYAKYDFCFTASQQCAIDFKIIDFVQASRAYFWSSFPRVNIPTVFAFPFDLYFSLKYLICAHILLELKETGFMPYFHFRNFPKTQSNIREPFTFRNIGIAGVE